MAHVSITAFFCEDIRQEKQQIVSLIGVLPENVNVPKIPGALPKLGLYVRANIDLDLRPDVTDLTLNLRFPNKSEHLLNTLKKEWILSEMDKVQSGGTYVGIVISAVAMNFNIPEEGLIQIVARFAGKEYVCGQMNAKALAPSEEIAKDTVN